MLNCRAGGNCVALVLIIIVAGVFLLIALGTIVCDIFAESWRLAISKLAVAKCDLCGCVTNTLPVCFRKNVSWFFSRKYRKFSGVACHSCMEAIYNEFQQATVSGKWWGIFGVIMGPCILIANCIQYCIASHHFFLS